SLGSDATVALPRISRQASPAPRRGSWWQASACSLAASQGLEMTGIIMSQTLRADVEVALPIEGKVRARQDAFFPLAHVPNRDVRCDPGADNPMEELASAVRRVGGEPVGLEPQSLLCPLDHRLCRSDLVVSAGWCCLYVDDDRVLDVDQVIEPIAE